MSRSFILSHVTPCYVFFSTIIFQCCSLPLSGPSEEGIIEGFCVSCVLNSLICWRNLGLFFLHQLQEGGTCPEMHTLYTKVPEESLFVIWTSAEKLQPPTGLLLKECGCSFSPLSQAVIYLCICILHPYATQQS